jgi:hypothetical protein
VRSFRTLPVFSVDAGSNSRMCAPPADAGMCSTPRGTMRNSPTSSPTTRFADVTTGSNSALDFLARPAIPDRPGFLKSRDCFLNRE